ncbi:MAG: YicC family protein [Oscillospiraceae bacterium]|nr:YicC family protein [Oscillospiraceae bacterium]
MAMSMTGFGRGQAVTPFGEVVVEFRSVNHRFFEFSARTPRGMAFLDEKLKKLANSILSRGKVDVGVTLVQSGASENVLVFKKDLAAQYVRALRLAGKEMKLKDDLRISDLLQMPDLFSSEKPKMDEEALWQGVEAAAKDALAQLEEMRRVEGEKMAADLLARLEGLENVSYEVETLSRETVKAHYDRLYGRLQELLADRSVDESRIVTEAAVFADKVATDEETVRLRSHIGQFRAILQEKGPVGRKLDFLVQELNREVNTIGSKCNDLNVTNLVVNQKSEIEKIREQVQNLE